MNRSSFWLYTVGSLLVAASIAITTAAPLSPQALPLRNTSIEVVRSPYAPTVGWTYAIEAIRSSPWPACPYRFLSFPDACDSVDLWRGAGVNQFWTMEAASPSDPSVFYIRGSCGSYLSYPGDCSVDKVDMWPSAGANQMFKFIPAAAVDDGSQFQYYISAVGRATCPLKFLSFPVPCTSQSPDRIDLWDAAGPEQTFRLFPMAAAEPNEVMVNTDGPCADPFTWFDTVSAMYVLTCTAPDIALYALYGDISPSSLFKFQGSALSGHHPVWASAPDMWAPETVPLPGNYGTAMFFADLQAKDNECQGTSPSDGSHRVGWVLDVTNHSRPGSWNVYSPSYLCLGPTQGGDIDPHIFTERDGSHYLVWKSDDNRLGIPITRIWAIQVNISTYGVSVIGQPRELLDSTELWWAAIDYVPNGYLIEGPEIVYRDPYYYLFFAAAAYCSPSYSEGVARSKSLWGPYEKLHIPLLSTGIVGAVKGTKLIGPGHASFVQSRRGDWMAVWHASLAGEATCVRNAFVSPLQWGDDGWPYIAGIL